jgi:putative hemolysin
MKRFVFAALACAVFLLPAADALAGSLVGAVAPAPGIADETAASAYCAKTGGSVVVRVPEYGTNGGKPLVLANPRNWCEYTGDGSKIDVLGATLYATKPSLAALAYYAEVQPGQCNGNPASCYCSLLGGTDLFGGVNAAGGGWVGPGGLNNVLDACIFPDESSIDSFGLFYHSHNIIRGKNLAKVLRYHK